MRKYQRRWNTGKQCVQQGKHRNAMSRNRIGITIGTETENGTKLETEILRAVLVILSSSAELNSGNLRIGVEAVDSGASKADEFQVELVQGV